MKINLKKISIFPFLLVIQIYKKGISPWMGNHCRYSPSCSTYMMESLEKFGLMKGLWLGTKRVVSCNPWGGKGYDPVPEK